MDWIQVAVNTGTGLLVGLITARVTVRYALRRFYAEKWWERKNAAYTAIIEAIHHIGEHADNNFEALRRDVEIPKDIEEDLTRKMREATAQLRLHRDVGSLVISQEATNRVNKLLSELEASATPGTTWLDHLLARINAVGECLTDVRRIACADLRLDELSR